MFSVFLFEWLYESTLRSPKTVESLEVSNLIGQWRLHLIFEYVGLENREQGNR